MSLKNKVEFSGKDIAKSLRDLADRTEHSTEQSFFLDDKKPGKSVYEGLEELYYTIRAKGMMKNYVKD